MIGRNSTSLSGNAVVFGDSFGKHVVCLVELMPAVALVLRLTRRNGSTRYGTGYSKIVYSVRIGPSQPIDEFRKTAGKAWYTPWYTITMSKTVLQRLRIPSVLL